MTLYTTTLYTRLLKTTYIAAKACKSLHAMVPLAASSHLEQHRRHQT